MDYTDKDKEVQRQIIEALCQRHVINMNKETGTLSFSPEDRDRVNPMVTITGDELKALTGRDKLREAVWTQYEQSLSRPGIAVERVPDALRVSIVPLRAPENEFNSLANLANQNQIDLTKDPELGDSPYEWL